MKKQSIIMFCGCIFMLSCLIVSYAHAVVVNLSAGTHNQYNPVELFLEAGIYMIEPIGINNGGLYNAYQRWGGTTTCNNNEGCQTTTPTTVMGWQHTHFIQSPDISYVEVDGLAITPITTKGSIKKNYFFLGNSYNVNNGLVFPSAISALEAAQRSLFTLDTAGLVGFSFGQDTLLNDNSGGVSLNITLVNETFDLSISFSGSGQGGVKVNPSDILCTSECTRSYSPNTVVTLTGIADSLSEFKGWTGDCSGTEDTCEITMDEAKSVEAVFSDKSDLPYSLRHLSQTKYGIDTAENHDNEWENQKEDDASPLTITHALYPFQIGTMSGNVDGYQWGSDLLRPVTALIREEKDTREPLILIHGWQADRDPDWLIFNDFKNRDPVELAKAPNPNENGYDAEGYWWSFLRYFATNDDLKNKYKIYLYQYPSYKHVTFNARMLSNMLYEVKYIRDWIGAGKKITILAHSMGGLVARSFLEEHGGIWSREGGEWKLFKSGENLLDKLITLDTPHHGSPAAVYPWIDTGASVINDWFIKKDIFSPGALDLWWDGYDGAYSNLSDAELGSCPVVGDLTNSWRDAKEISFDNFYRNKIGDTVPREIINVDGYYMVLFFLRPNPWLTYLNSLHQVDTWKDKYIFYGGYNDAQTGHWANKLEDTGMIGGGDNFWFTGVWEAGYLNDAPVPVTSSFFDKTENVADHAGWPSSHQIGLGMFNNFDADKSKNILKDVNEDNFKIRYFRDYHHDRMLNGAYYHPKHRYKTPSTPDTCSQRGVWAWDLIPNSELIAPCSTGDGGYWPRTYSGFREEQFRLDYIKDSGACVSINDLSVNINNDAKDASWISTLKYEPLFLMLEQDLLPSVSHRGCFSWEMFLPAILRIKSTSSGPSETYIDINSKNNTLDNPVEIYLTAGTYMIESVGKDNGIYDAWNAWGGDCNCYDSNGCQRGTTTRIMGWLNSHYYVISSNIIEATVGSVTLTPISTPGKPYESFFITGNYYNIDDGLAYPSALDAFVRAPSSTFTLSADGVVGFACKDGTSLYGDNVGGLSLRISTVVNSQQ